MQKGSVKLPTKIGYIQDNVYERIRKRREELGEWVYNK